MPDLHRIVDAGCGEGYYAKGIADKIHSEIFALDVAREAVQIAARGANAVRWLVSDITNIPLKQNTIDCVLNIFTPANYAEFSRVLTEHGILIKIIPGPGHLRELRHAAREQLRQEEYSGQQVADYFLERFQEVERTTLTKTLPVPPDLLESLLSMTPLLFHVDKNGLDRNALSHITIEAEILIGRSMKAASRKKSPDGFRIK